MCALITELDPLTQQLEQQSLAWLCAFCPKLRVCEGGSRFRCGQLEWCLTCDSTVVVDHKDQEAIIAAVDRHLS